MSQETPADTRSRILTAALREFTARGFHETSVRQIAERVGISKAAVLYHFPGKAEILGVLAAPLLDDLDVALATARSAAPERRRWSALEGVLDVWLTHRYLLRLNLQDLALASAGSLFARYRDRTMEAVALVAGERPDLAARVRATQAVGMLADPVVVFADEPADELRAAVLAGVHRLLDEAPPTTGQVPAVGSPARPAGGTQPGLRRPGGNGRGAATEPVVAQRPAAAAGGQVPGDRPAEVGGPASVRPRGRRTVVTPAMVRTARRRYTAGESADQIAADLGISRATLYRHLAAAGNETL